MANKAQKLCLVVLLMSGFTLILIAIIARTKTTLEGTFKVGING